MTLSEKIEYIKRNYGEIPIRLIAEDTGMSRSSVVRMAKRLNIHVPPEQMRELKCVKKSFNPNPVTETTKMLICHYYSEGSSINHIAYTLGRPREVVREILDEFKM